MKNDYYSSPRLSQSFLKLMAKSLGEIHKFNKIGERNFNLKLHDSMVIGSAVDCMITTPAYFSSEFILYGKKPPSDTLVKLFTYLQKYSENHSIGLQSLIYYEKIIGEYLDSIKYEKFGGSRGKFATALDKIYAAEDYWVFLQSSEGKSIIDSKRMHVINHAYNVLTNHRFTKELIDYQCINQLHLILDYKDLELKGLLDKLLINDTDTDHRFSNGLVIPARSITVLDIKTGNYRPENLTDYMNRWRIDLQLAFYTMLARHNYPDYSVNNPLIVYTQNSTQTNYPSVKKLSNSELSMGRFGSNNNNIFTSYYPLNNDYDVYGFEQCIDIYKRYLEHGWDIDWKLNMNNGLCN